MLLETKLIAKLALLLGTTWTVNTFVISAVLVMILLANLVVIRGWAWAGNPVLCLLPLTALILADWLMRERSLTLSFRPGLNIILVLLFLSLPVFFAGLVFATLYQRSKIPSVALGYNLFGAMVGGLLEQFHASGNQQSDFVVSHLVCNFSRNSVAAWTDGSGCPIPGPSINCQVPHFSAVSSRKGGQATHSR